MYKYVVHALIVRDVQICCTCSHRTKGTIRCTWLSYDMYKYVVHDYRTRCANMLYMLSPYERYNSLYMIILLDVQICRISLIVQEVQIAVHNNRTRSTILLYMNIVREVRIAVHDYRMRCTHMLYMLSSYDKHKLLYKISVRDVQIAVHDYRTRCANPCTWLS